MMISVAHKVFLAYHQNREVAALRQRDLTSARMQSSSVRSQIKMMVGDDHELKATKVRGCMGVL